MLFWLLNLDFAASVVVAVRIVDDTTITLLVVDEVTIDIRLEEANIITVKIEDLATYTGRNG